METRSRIKVQPKQFVIFQDKAAGHSAESPDALSSAGSESTSRKNAEASRKQQIADLAAIGKDIGKLKKHKLLQGACGPIPSILAHQKSCDKLLYQQLSRYNEIFSGNSGRFLPGNLKG